MSPSRCFLSDPVQAFDEDEDFRKSAQTNVVELQGPEKCLSQMDPNGTGPKGGPEVQFQNTCAFTFALHGSHTFNHLNCFGYLFFFGPLHEQKQ